MKIPACPGPVMMCALLIFLPGCEKSPTSPAKQESAPLEISLEAFKTSTATSDTIANNVCGMARGVVYQGRLYVACQRLEAWQPADTSLLVVINTANDSVEGAIPLALRNPQDMVLFNGRLYLACTGAYGALDGGVEVVNPATGASEGSVMTEADVNGDVSRLALVSATRAYVLVTKNDYTSEIRPFNPATGSVDPALSHIIDASAGPVYDGRYVYVGERSGSAPGVVVIDPLTGAKIRGPLSTGLAPYSMASVGSAVAVIGTNYSEGNLSSLDPDSGTVRPDLMALSGDAVAAACGGLLYVLDRYNATVSRLSPPFDSAAVDYQLNVGTGSNPYDIVFAGPGKAYVIRYNSNFLWVIDPSTGSRVMK